MEYKLNIVLLSIIIFSILFSCKKDNGENHVANPVGELQITAEYSLNIPEPSGLSFGPDSTTLLIVSDNTNKIYETDLDGTVIRELAYTGFDLEGVTFNLALQNVVVTEERQRQIVFLNYESGEELERFDIVTNGSTENKGLEGLSYNINNKAYYLVNEDLPGEMIVWNKEYGNINSIPLNFASDYSAIFVDTKNALLWIVSDETQALYKCDYNAKVLMEYTLPGTKFEGVVVDADNQWVYLVNDKTAKLYIFKLLN